MSNIIVINELIVFTVYCLLICDKPNYLLILMMVCLLRKVVVNLFHAISWVVSCQFGFLKITLEHYFGHWIVHLIDFPWVVLKTVRENE